MMLKKWCLLMGMLLILLLNLGYSRAEPSGPPPATMMFHANTGNGEEELSSGDIANGTPEDVTIQKSTLNLTCDFDWSPQAFTVSCSDGTNTLSALYQVAYINTSQANSTTDQISAYLSGNFHSNINGVQKTGLSSGFFSGAAKMNDNTGIATSTTLTVTLFGGISSDFLFQMNEKLTLMPPF